MQTTIISDTHTRHEELNLPGGDLLIHSGDFMGSGNDVFDIIGFRSWLLEQDYKYIIIVAGNHERLFEDEPSFAEEMLTNNSNITYLQDSSVVIEGIKFYGSPYTPAFCNWAFQLHNDEEAKEKWNSIPTDTDVLITHGPAYGILDQITTPVMGDNLGCKELQKRIEEINPKVHICGHIHSSQGILDGYGEITTHINAACLGEDYNFTNNKQYIEWSI